MRNSEQPNDTARRHQQRLEHLTAAAREAGIKLTHQRLEIFRELVASEEHPDAEAVYRAVQRRVPTVSLDTVYRTLWRLHELGLVTTVGPRRDGMRFDANIAPHHHYVCVRCGMVRDFDSPELTELSAHRLPASLKRLGTIADAHVEVRGLCAACQGEPRPAPPRSEARDAEPRPRSPTKTRTTRERRGA